MQCTSGGLSFYGVQLNFNPASLGNGWSLCYNDTYAVAMNSTLLSNILSICNKQKLMLGCSPVGSIPLTVAAMGLRNDVLYNCSTSTNCTHVANGVGWYFSFDYSWGFVNSTDDVYRFECDELQVNSSNRLCWHTLDYYVGGYRCGATLGLNGDLTFQRVIYHAN